MKKYLAALIMVAAGIYLARDFSRFRKNNYWPPKEDWNAAIHSTDGEAREYA